MDSRDAPSVVIGDVVQIRPDCSANLAFGGCMMVVSELKSFGVQGYVQSLGTREKLGGQAYIRLGWEEFERTGGRAVWDFERGEDD